ncbi:MAG: hypothetical protein AAGF87_07525 [Bacteroidota bacterium]
MSPPFIFSGEPDLIFVQYNGELFLHTRYGNILPILIKHPHRIRIAARRIVV